MSLAGELLYFEKANHRNIKLILQEHRGAWEPFRGIFESIGVEAVRYEPHKCHGTYEADCRNILVENENIVNRAAPFEKGARQIVKSSATFLQQILLESSNPFLF